MQMWAGFTGILVRSMRRFALRLRWPVERTEDIERPAAALAVGGRGRVGVGAHARGLVGAHAVVRRRPQVEHRTHGRPVPHSGAADAVVRLNAKRHRRMVCTYGGKAKRNARSDDAGLKASRRSLLGLAD